MPDNAVIEQLVSSHRQFLSFLLKRVESKEVAEDILQNAFVRSLEHASELRDDESAVAWFYRVLRNATIDHYRRRDSTQRAYDGWGRELNLQEMPDALTRAEICQCVSALAATLKPEYQEALRVVDLEDGSLNDLAGKMSITAGNAAVRVHRAREALRKRRRAEPARNMAASIANVDRKIPEATIRASLDETCPAEARTTPLARRAQE